MAIKRYPADDDVSGNSAELIYALPEGQAVIVKSDTTVVDLIGVRANTAGVVYLKYKNDAGFLPRTMAAGEIAMGRIVGIGAATVVLDADLLGLK